MTVVTWMLAGCGTPKRVVQPTPPTPQPMPDTVAATPWQRPVVPGIRTEIRGVWLTTIFGLDWPRAKADSESGLRYQQQELLGILDRLKNDGYNTVFLQVRLRGDLIYPNNTEPQSNIFTRSGRAPNYDPMAFALQACHERGLQCHAWLVTFPIGQGKRMRVKHRDWCLYHRGEWYLDPGLPEVRSYLADLVADLVRRYPTVDGIHMDYVRYPDDADRFPDQKSYERYGGGQSRIAWRRNNITDLWRRIDKALTPYPAVQISAATLGKLRLLEQGVRPHGWTALESVHQDVMQWDREQLIDMVVPMMYYKDDLFEPFLLDWQCSMSHAAVVAGLAPYRMAEGAMAARWKPADITCQMDYADKVQVQGVCFFREEFVGNRYPMMRDSIRQRFCRPSLLPALPRGEKFRTTAPTDLKIQGSRLTWQHEDAKQPRPTTYRVWATVLRANGSMESLLLAQRLSETAYTLPTNLLHRGDEIELGVEAVNALGVATACLRSVKYKQP